MYTAHFPILQHYPFSAWHAPFGASHHLSPKRGNQVAIHFTSSVSSPPLGGDAVGRGGSISGHISMLGLRFTVSGFLIPNP